MISPLKDLFSPLFSDNGQAFLRVQPKLFEVLKTHQLRDGKLAQILADIDKFFLLGYTLQSDGILLFRGRIYIPSDEK